MAIALVGTPAYADQGSFSTNTPTLSVTVPSGTDLLVIIATINDYDWSKLTGLTVNGSATGVTQQATTPSAIANRSVRIWTLVSPAAGTYNIVWSYTTSSNNGGGLCATCWTGTDLTTPVSANNNSSTGGGASPLTTTITVASGGVAVAGIQADTAQPTPGGTQTALGTSESNHAFSYKLNATGMSATFTGSPQIAQAVVALNPAASGDATASGATLTATSTLSPGAASATAAGSAPGATLSSTSSLSAGSATATNYGTLTTLPLKNNTGTILASETGIVLNIYHMTTGALIVQKTGVTTDASGIAVVTDSLIVASTTYAYEPVLTGGRRRLPTKAAT